MKRISSKTLFLFFLLSIFFMAGCKSTVHIRVENPEQPKSQDNTTLLAGASRVDITPPPGMPMAGYSANANYGEGFRTRIYASVVYLKGAGDRPVAIVQCDLLAGSELVSQRLAEMIADKTDLDAGGIMMSGTHTHSGPGNLFGSNFYVKNASNKSGLDMEFFDFVTERISSAIIEAYENRVPARIATGYKEVYGYTRNRSIMAYSANENADPEKAADIHRAVNPGMYMLRVDGLNRKTGSYHPIAAVTSFSIHGTTVPASNRLYNADVYAYITKELEWNVNSKNPDFVHAVINGTHADNSPDVGRQGFSESRRIGVALGEKSIELFNSLERKFQTNPETRSAIREVNYYKNNKIDGEAICETPRVGSTLVAGAGDGGPTPVLNRLPYFKEGSRRRVFTGGCHGNRRIIGGRLQSLVLPKDEFPHRIIYQVVQIGDMVFIPLPYEVTMESGNRIAAAAANSAVENGMNGVNHFVVVSCSNGFTGYSTTAEEYSMQRYEGGHTLYGPGTSGFLAAQVSRLLGDMVSTDEPVIDLPSEREYVLKSRSFYREYDPPEGLRKVVEEPDYKDKEDRKRREESFWGFRWQDVPPSLMEWHRPIVSIEYSNDRDNWLPLEINGVPVNDEGYDIAVIFTDRITRKSMGIYETRWYNPEVRPERWYRFRIEPRDRQELFFSPPFRKNE